MPELPEVETVRRGLQAQLPGRRIVAAKVLREASVGYPEAKKFPKLVTGKTFADIGRRGKYLLLNLDAEDATMVVHLRMSGALLILPRSRKNTSHARIEFELDDKRFLVFDDTRVFGRIWYISPAAMVNEIISGLNAMGPEPMDAEFTVDYLLESFAGKKQAIKTTLLDQSIIAGIGNIYADESLHLAAIHPQRQAQTLSRKELTRLASCVQMVLGSAIEAGGSTIRDYVNADGVNGNYQGQAYVYGREKEDCRTCGRIITRIKLNGRSSFFCGKCQKPPATKDKKT